MRGSSRRPTPKQTGLPKSRDSELKSADMVLTK